MALSASELRIGNLILLFSKRICKVIKIEGKSFTVKADDISDVSVFPNMSNGVEPIPLTEEWLIKFGFELYENAGIYGLYREIFPPVSGFEITADSEGYWYWPSGMFNATKIKYVHQLQNLYFALTGEELTYK